MTSFSTQKRRLAHGRKYSANSKFFISAMLASGSNWSLILENSIHFLFFQTCRQFLDNWSDLERYCGYRENNIPQLEDINRWKIFCSFQDLMTECQVPSQQDWFSDSASRGLPYSQVSTSLAKVSLNIFIIFKSLSQHFDYWKESL